VARLPITFGVARAAMSCATGASALNAALNGVETTLGESPSAALIEGFE
jgi:hypothetical protein